MQKYIWEIHRVIFVLPATCLHRKSQIDWVSRVYLLFKIILYVYIPVGLIAQLFELQLEYTVLKKVKFQVG